VVVPNAVVAFGKVIVEQSFDWMLLFVVIEGFSQIFVHHDEIVSKIVQLLIEILEERVVGILRAFPQCIWTLGEVFPDLLTSLAKIIDKLPILLFCVFFGLLYLVEMQAKLHQLFS
jgi:hypothetical protein